MRARRRRKDIVAIVTYLTILRSKSEIWAFRGVAREKVWPQLARLSLQCRAMPEDITPQLTTVSASVMDELLGRLDADLSEEDLTAIATAISKAVMRAAKVMAASVPNVEILDPDPEEVDIWADMYGG
jgi:hypothetical protein